MLSAKIHNHYPLRVVTNNTGRPATPVLVPLAKKPATVKGLAPRQISPGPAAIIFSLFGFAIAPGVKEVSKIITSDRQFRRLLSMVPSALAQSAFTAYNRVADHPADLFAAAKGEVLAVSKTVTGKHYLLVYNPCTYEPIEACIALDYEGSDAPTKLSVLYGYDTCAGIPVNTYRSNGRMVTYVKLYLKPLHVAVLSY